MALTRAQITFSGLLRLHLIDRIYLPVGHQAVALSRLKGKDLNEQSTRIAFARGLSKSLSLIFFSWLHFEPLFKRIICRPPSQQPIARQNILRWCDIPAAYPNKSFEQEEMNLHTVFHNALGASCKGCEFRWALATFASRSRDLSTHPSNKKAVRIQFALLS